MTWIEYLKSKAAWKHFLFMGLSLIGLVFIVLLSLNTFTRHGQSIEIPDFSGYTLEELEYLKTDYDFSFVVRDSVYDPTKKAGSILAQSPLPQSKVKRGRRIYFVLAASTPKMVNMPNLIDLSLRQASSLLETYGLVLGTIRSDPTIPTKAVLQQSIKGVELSPGNPILRGSIIDLVLGGGEGFIVDSLGSVTPDSNEIVEETEGL